MDREKRRLEIKFLNHEYYSAAFRCFICIEKNELLKITDILGEQVSDLICYNYHDKAEYLSSGRTIDYADTIRLTAGHSFYSNRSNVMFKLTEDTVGKHDFLLTPCSAETFRIIYGTHSPMPDALEI